MDFHKKIPPQIYLRIPDKLQESIKF